MTSYPAILDLLEQYIAAHGGGEQWLTAREIRDHYRMERTGAHRIAGILQRVYKNPTFSSPFRVVRIEKMRDPAQPYRMVMRYLVSTSKEAGSEPHARRVRQGVPGRMQ